MKTLKISIEGATGSGKTLMANEIRKMIEASDHPIYKNAVVHEQPQEEFKDILLVQIF